MAERFGVDLDRVRAFLADKEERRRGVFTALRAAEVRHFKGYYFELEYDWDRLDFLAPSSSRRTRWSCAIWSGSSAS